MLINDIDIEAVLAPVKGENPAGKDLRYLLYDEIKKARKEEETYDPVSEKTVVKSPDWDKVIELSVEALVNKTKDLQIAAWLTEALVRTDGFNGLFLSLKILNGFLNDYWEQVYPVIPEDGDLEYRADPLEVMNGRLPLFIKQIPITDSEKTSGYSWFKWEESLQVGSEVDCKGNRNKKKEREKLIAEGKLTAEDFNAAFARSSKKYYQELGESLTSCFEEFNQFEQILHDKFGRKHAPIVSEIRKALEDCERLVINNLLKGKGPDPEPEPEPEKEEAPADRPEEMAAEREEVEQDEETLPPSMTDGRSPVSRSSDEKSLEKAIWEEAQKDLKTSGIKKALGLLYRAYCSLPSVREKNRYRLLMAKLCLKAERPDLARPIIEELNALIEELHLERWEPPMWIAEVFDALYQCLTAGEPSDDDLERAGELFKKICTIDVTKACFIKN